jgi:hypothetical protein
VHIIGKINLPQTTDNYIEDLEINTILEINGYPIIFARLMPVFGDNRYKIMEI